MLFLVSFFIIIIRDCFVYQYTTFSTPDSGSGSDSCDACDLLGPQDDLDFTSGGAFDVNAALCPSVTVAENVRVLY